MTRTPPPISDAALLVVHSLHELFNHDPKVAYVAAMTAAAIAGHIIERTPEQMHATLDEVNPVALAKMLAVTEKKQ